MRQKEIKNLIFDFGGVLINLDRQRCIDTFKEVGLDHVDELIDPFAQQGVFMQLEKGQITPAEFRDKIRDLAGKSIPDKSIDDAWNSFLVDIPRYKLEALLELRKHYMVYLLSNTNEIHWHWSCKYVFPYRSFRVADYFDTIFLSYEMQLAKPDIRIFETVLDQAGILPEETLFIDDSQANCKAAESLGISVHCCQPGEDWTPFIK